MMKRGQISSINLLMLLLSLMFFNQSFAVDLGSMASGALGPVNVAGDMIDAASQILGVGLLIASVIRYGEHRKRPVQVRIATPILFFLFGVFLTCLPYIASYSSSPVPTKHSRAKVSATHKTYSEKVEKEAAFMEAQLEAQRRAAERALDKRGY